MSKFKVFLTFPQKLVNEPIIYDIGQKYAVITNIRGASVTDEIAEVLGVSRSTIRSDWAEARGWLTLYLQDRTES